MLKLMQQNKKYLIFSFITIIIGIIVGIIYYNLLNVEVKNNISYLLNDFNNYRHNSIMKDFIIMSLLLITSLFIIGIPLCIFYLFYESLSIGFLISIFMANFKFSGLFYMLVYILINKLLIFILLILFIPKLFNIARHIIGLLIYRKDNYLVNKIVYNFKNSIYIIIFVLIINIILYFITPYIFNNLDFLLK